MSENATDNVVKVASRRHRTPIAGRNLFVPLLLIATVLVDGAIYAARGQWPAWTASAAMGLAFAQLLLLVTWVVWGPWFAVARLMATIAAAALLAHAISGSIGAEWREGMTMLSAYAAAVGLSLVAARLAGLRFERLQPADATAINPTQRPWQFSLWTLMSSMTMAALVFGVARMLAFPLREAWDLTLFTAGMLLIGLFPLAWSAWIKSAVWGVVGLLLVPPLLGLMLPMTGLPPSRPEDYVALALMTGIQGAWTGLSIAAVRAAGFGLVYERPRTAAMGTHS
jgi:hypothetical protein